MPDFKSYFVFLLEACWETPPTHLHSLVDPDVASVIWRRLHMALALKESVTGIGFTVFLKARHKNSARAKNCTPKFKPKALRHRFS